VPAEPLLLIRYRSLIAEFMRSQVRGLGSFAGIMVSYHMGWCDREGRPEETKTGKLIRPSLSLWACTALGADASRALPAAAAVEWFHNFTLVHDDIQDADRMRHGRETVWSIWGVPQAINAGDAMHALAFVSLAASATHSEAKLRAIAALGRAGMVVIEGQCLDLQLEGRADASVRTYLRMVRAKTGALLGASMESGALLSGAGPSRAARFRTAGLQLGTAFQIRDDWLGTYGDPALTGKSVTADASRSKSTFPVVARLRRSLDESGAEELTRVTANRYAQKAVETIRRAGVAGDRLAEFVELAEYVAKRDR
jgi:geranylgeranyl diphosphate synthase type I